MTQFITWLLNIIQLMQKLAYEIGNRLVGKSEYLRITYELTEFTSRIEARFSAVVLCLILLLKFKKYNISCALFLLLFLHCF